MEEEEEEGRRDFARGRNLAPEPDRRCGIARRKSNAAVRLGNRVLLLPLGMEEVCGNERAPRDREG